MPKQANNISTVGLGAARGVCSCRGNKQTDRQTTHNSEREKEGIGFRDKSEPVGFESGGGTRQYFLDILSRLNNRIMANPLVFSGLFPFTKK